MHDPRESHLAALKRLLRYVRGTVDFGLVLHRSPSTELVVYTDADWAGCPDTRRSGSRLSPAPMLRWSTVLSLTAWRRRLGYDSSWRSSTARSLRAHSSPVTTSVPCISPPTPSSISRRSMWRSTCSSCATESPSAMFGVLHVPTTSQFADIFTKGLPSSTFSEFRSSLNVAGG